MLRLWFASRRSLPSSWRGWRAAGVFVLLGVLALTGCASPFGSHNAPPKATAAPNPISPAWTAVLNQIGPNGEVSLATAEQAYALAFGPLPGVSAPANTSGKIPDGTLALRMILAHYNDLNAAQQQTVLQRFGYKAPTAKSGTGAPVAAIAGVTRAIPAKGALNPTPVPTDDPGTANYRTMLNGFIPKLNAALNYTLTLQISLAIDPKAKKNGAEATTACFNSNGEQTGTAAWCQIKFDPSLSSETTDDQEYVVAHELFHCYQAALLGELSTAYVAPSWIIEGSATWVGAAISGVSSQSGWMQDHWGGWLTNSGKTLFSRAYDAIGFYALINQAGISPWKAIPAMLASQHLGPSNTAAYTAATQADPQHVLDLWAASDFRDPSLGADWDLRGPGITDASGMPSEGYRIATGTTLSDSAPAYTAQEYLLDPQADVIDINFSGTSRLHDGASFDQAGTANGDYCTRDDGNCTCPQGSAYTGPALEKLQGALSLALTGGLSGADGSVTGMSLDEFCQHKLKVSVPNITLVYCNHVMTLKEANTIMKPPITATTIRVDKSPAGGSCNYEYKLYNAVLTLIFIAYTRGAANAASDLAAQAAKISSNPDAVTTVTPVKGMGNAAVFVTATIASPPLRLAAVDVIDGSLFLECGNFNVGSASFADQQTKLMTACQQVLSRL